MRKNRRNAGLELMRLVMMFGIVLLHVAGHGAYINKFTPRFLDWCVCGFVFLSGYFGIRFSAMKCHCASGARLLLSWNSIVIEKVLFDAFNPMSLYFNWLARPDSQSLILLYFAANSLVVICHFF